MSNLKEHIYLSPNYPTREALEAAVETGWDATTASGIARCPRFGEYKIRYGLEPKTNAVYLRAGNALHGAMALHYAGAPQDLVLAELRNTWGAEDQVLPAGHSFSHLNLPFLETVLKNYFDYSKKADNFRPLTMKLDDLDLTNVLAAMFQLTPDGHVILGECKIIMKFQVDGEQFIYSGKPDLPVEMGGAIYMMDHKSTSGYLSSWYFDQYRFSNQLRGYCAMLAELTHLQVNGALINGMYVGEKAASSEFKGNRFGRYGPMLYQPAHLTEALRNQRAWQKVLDYYEAQGYYPQHASKLCSNCPFESLCAATPAIRESVMKTEFVYVDRKFLDL